MQIHGRVDEADYGLQSPHQLQFVNANTCCSFNLGLPFPKLSTSSKMEITNSPSSISYAKISQRSVLNLHCAFIESFRSTVETVKRKQEDLYVL